MGCWRPDCVLLLACPRLVVAMHQATPGSLRSAARSQAAAVGCGRDALLLRAYIIPMTSVAARCYLAPVRVVGLATGEQRQPDRVGRVALEPFAAAMSHGRTEHIRRADGGAAQKLSGSTLRLAEVLQGRACPPSADTSFASLSDAVGVLTTAWAMKGRGFFLRLRRRSGTNVPLEAAGAHHAECYAGARTSALW